MIKRKRILSLVLSLAVAFGLFIGMGTEVEAAEILFGNLTVDVTILENGDVIKGVAGGKATVIAYCGTAGESDMLGMDGGNNAGLDITVDGSTYGFSSWKVKGLRAAPARTIILVPYMTSVPQVTSSSAPACDHNFEWQTSIEATETQDGEEIYVCTKCGDVADSVIGAGETCAYGKYLKNVEQKIKNAKQGETIVIDTDIWTNFNQKDVQVLKDRPDVSVIIKYKEKGVRYQIVIPAGYNWGENLDKYYGFAYFATLFGRSEITK